MAQKTARSWIGSLMMVVSILAVCVLVPMGFMAGEPFSRWLHSVGVHTSPNLAGGYPIAEFDGFERFLPDSLPGVDLSEARRALAIRRFSVTKVAFRRWSGMGIDPRLNLSFEFDGHLPDPHHSPSKFSMTVIHVYIRVPSKEPGPALSDKTAKVGFAGAEWSHQVVIDGFHEQARIFDRSGNLVARGLGLYVDREGAPNVEQSKKADAPKATTRITAALPLEYLEDPAKGDWHYYVLVGVTDSRNPSMMLHSEARDRLRLFSGALDRPANAGDKPILRPMVVKNSA